MDYRKAKPFGFRSDFRRAAGVEKPWKIEVDPADFYEEPDWDEWR